MQGTNGQGNKQVGFVTNAVNWDLLGEILTAEGTDRSKFLNAAIKAKLESSAKPKPARRNRSRSATKPPAATATGTRELVDA
jgi:hypothetical protein